MESLDDVYTRAYDLIKELDVKDALSASKDFNMLRVRSPHVSDALHELCIPITVLVETLKSKEDIAEAITASLMNSVFCSKDGLPGSNKLFRSLIMYRRRRRIMVEKRFGQMDGLFELSNHYNISAPPVTIMKTLVKIIEGYGATNPLVYFYRHKHKGKHMYIIPDTVLDVIRVIKPSASLHRSSVIALDPIAIDLAVGSSKCAGVRVDSVDGFEVFPDDQIEILIKIPVYLNVKKPNLLASKVWSYQPKL